MADRLPWHSDTQHAEVVGHLRAAEEAIKGDALAESPAVVPPAPVQPKPVNPAAAVAAGAGAIDYDKLAAAIVKAQTAAKPADPAPAAEPVPSEPVDSGHGYA
ncbi:MAG TPA: hypothetical protein VKU91_00235 [Acidimicrobiales bacterium]|nr:hypothetical protein [Acidimicrobiales bacterium]